MEKLYSDKFAKLASVRPKYYDKIMVSSAGRCPICGVGVVSNLDHYLAKSIYPTYIMPGKRLIIRRIKLEKLDKLIFCA